jgi:hypothetical protein
VEWIAGLLVRVGAVALAARIRRLVRGGRRRPGRHERPDHHAD